VLAGLNASGGRPASTEKRRRGTRASQSIADRVVFALKLA
jgi:hypothetical protein